MVNCRELQGYIFDRVLGEILPGSIEKELEEHLSRCPGCRRLREEAGSAWRSLEGLAGLRFPDSLTRRVLAAAVPRPRRIRRLHLGPGRLALAAASVAAAAGLFFFIRRAVTPDAVRTSDPLRLASTYSRRPLPAPDLTATLEEYLDEAGAILSGLANRGYPSWGMVLSEIISRDIQGRSNYLLESSELPDRARPVIGGLHQAFWVLLQTGRGREGEAVELPLGVEPALLQGEIENYRMSDPIIPARGR